MAPAGWRWRLALAAALATALTGCANLRFYAQAATGQAALMLARRDVREVLADPRTDPGLAAQLRLATAMLRFAERELALPVGGRYRDYVALRRDAPLWNVVAAEEFGVVAVPRCYPLIGCAIYRGFFSKRGAERERDRLAKRYDVMLRPVAAYSTLGWFDDPLLSSFIHYEETRLAELLFHELAHGVVYARDDSVFNESFASFVGVEGVSAWLAARGEDAAAHRRARARTRQADRAFTRFLIAWRERLRALYALPIDAAAKRQLKGAAFAALRAAYQDCRGALGGGRYDAFMAAPFNNARLLAAGAYRDWQSGFARVFEAKNGNWSAFFERVRELAKLPPDERRALLALTDHDAAVCGAPAPVRARIESAAPERSALAGIGGDAEALGEQEQRRYYGEAQRRRADDAAEHWRGDAAHHFRPGSVAKHDGS